jgi:uroporphyrin-3 C-methyltransferase
MTNENKNDQLLADEESNADSSNAASKSSVAQETGGEIETTAEADIFSAAVENDSMTFDMLERIARRARRTAWFALLLVLLVAAAVGYAGWMLLEQQDKMATVDSATQAQQQQAGAINNDLQTLASSTQQQMQRVTEHVASLEQLLNQSNKVIEGQGRRLLSLTATSTDDWRIAEVEYLLRLANQRLLISKDAATTLDLLTAADQILLQLGDPRLIKLRQSIASDRAAIAMVGVVDFDGVFTSLAALSSQVNALPLHSEPVFNAADNRQVSVVSEQDVWYSAIMRIAQSTWQELKSLVVIQLRSPDLKPLLPPEQQYYLRNNLRLILAQAQLALLDGRQVIYKQSLDNAVAWLRDYFPQQETAVQYVAAELARLSVLQIASEYPDLSASLLAVKGFIAAQHSDSGGGSNNNEVPAGQESTQ